MASAACGGRVGDDLPGNRHFEWEIEPAKARQGVAEMVVRSCTGAGGAQRLAQRTLGIGDHVGVVIVLGKLH